MSINPISISPDFGKRYNLNDIGDSFRTIDNIGDEYSQALSVVFRLEKEYESARKMKEALSIREREVRYKTLAGLSPSICILCEERANSELEKSMKKARGVFALITTAVSTACFASLVMAGSNPIYTALAFAGASYFANTVFSKVLGPMFFYDFVFPRRLDKVLSDEIQRYELDTKIKLEDAKGRLKEIEQKSPENSYEVKENSLIIEEEDSIDIDGVKIKKR